MNNGMNNGMNIGMQQQMQQQGRPNMLQVSPPQRIPQIDPRKAALQGGSQNGGGGLNMNSGNEDRRRMELAQRRASAGVVAAQGGANQGGGVGGRNRGKEALQNENGLGIQFGGDQRQKQRQREMNQRNAQRTDDASRPLMGTRERDKAKLQGQGGGFYGGGDGALKIGYGQNNGTFYFIDIFLIYL